MRKKAVLLSMATVAGLSVGVAPPAFANDLTLDLVTQAGLEARGRWDDSIDTLCARAFSYPVIIRASVYISPVSGSGPSFSVHDGTPHNGTNVCTGNLSIPEDRRYKMTVIVTYSTGGGHSKSAEFYT